MATPPPAPAHDDLTSRQVKFSAPQEGREGDSSVFVLSRTGHFGYSSIHISDSVNIIGRTFMTMLHLNLSYMVMEAVMCFNVNECVINIFL